MGYGSPISASTRNLRKNSFAALNRIEQGTGRENMPVFEVFGVDGWLCRRLYLEHRKAKSRSLRDEYDSEEREGNLPNFRCGMSASVVTQIFAL